MTFLTLLRALKSFHPWIYIQDIIKYESHERTSTKRLLLPHLDNMAGYASWLVQCSVNIPTPYEQNLSPFSSKKFVVVYLDDILVYSRTPEEHAQHLRVLLQTGSFRTPIRSRPFKSGQQSTSSNKLKAFWLFVDFIAVSSTTTPEFNQQRSHETQSAFTNLNHISIDAGKSCFPSGRRPIHGPLRNSPAVGSSPSHIAVRSARVPNVSPEPTQQLGGDQSNRLPGLGHSAPSLNDRDSHVTTKRSRSSTVQPRSEVSLTLNVNINDVQDVAALLDSGATADFIDSRIVWTLNYTLMH
ncbi:hypothetical protein JCM33374_g3273 [Metschnikowia sp. JCM 33374]|nr:hypothetical protein JCM33374_g3273 [Metschnikowia sp. JCM 33374]